MINYLLRRVVYGILILLGVNLITFVLFFAVNTPDDMARLNLGGRRVTADAIEAWKAARGLDKPLFINTAAEGVQKITDTVFFERSVPLLFFDFGRSDSGRDIGYEISTRMWPSLALAVPTFLLGLIVMVAWSLLVVLFRRTRVEAAAIGLSVFLMSISSLFYIIVGQWLFSKLMRLFPISGWADGWGCTAFLVLPVLIALFSRLGSDTLLYRAMFLEEIGRDYVRTARAKGLSGRRSTAASCAPKCCASHHHLVGSGDSNAFYGKPHYGKLLRHSRSGELYDRRFGGTGLFRRTHDGFSRHLRLHHRLDCYRYRLCLGGSAHPTRLMRSRLSQDSSEHRSIRHASCFPSD